MGMERTEVLSGGKFLRGLTLLISSQVFSTDSEDLWSLPVFFQIESLPRLGTKLPRSVDTSRRKRRSKKKYRFAMKSYNINVSEKTRSIRIFFVF